MPKIVDHDARRAELAQAVWAVVRDRGLDQASIRVVAAQAGSSQGSLRHYFATQSELLSFALQVVDDRVRARLAALDRDPEPMRAARQVLHELLPLDDERRAENEVWLAFTARALVDPSLRELHDSVDDALRAAYVGIAETLGLDDPQLEAERLHAVMAGLCVHAALNGQGLPAGRIRAVIDHHLDSLVNGCGAGGNPMEQHPSKPGLDHDAF